MENIDHPLVVDLDGTLTPSDTLWEMIFRLLLGSPLKLIRLIPHLLKSKADFKKQIALSSGFSPLSLVYTNELLDYIRTQKLLGRRIVLATAADEFVAKSIFNHFSFFDSYHASDGIINLRGKNKAELLVKLYGNKQFLYAGNDSSDFKVWNSASRVIIVNASPRLLAKATNLYRDYTVINTTKNSFLLWFKQLRIYQWVKNILIFIPLILAHKYYDFHLFVKSLLAFLAFGLAASSVYCINDLFDLKSDRLHLKKRNRPIASGLIPLLNCLVGLCFLSLFALLIAWHISLRFAIVILSYYIINLIYTFSFKKLAIVDVIVLATLYMLRIVSGSIATDITISFWLLTFSIFIFISLGFLKRYKELRQLNQTDVTQIPGRFYHTDDLEVVSTMGIASGYLSCLVLVFYLKSPDISGFYHHIEYLWAGCLLILYWISKTWLLAHRNTLDDDPVLHAIKDKESWLIFAILVILLLLAHST